MVLHRRRPAESSSHFDPRKEIERLERGEEAPPGEQLFDRFVFKEALPTISEARLVQTLYAEHPDLREFISRLSGEKTEQTLENLSALWEMPRSEAAEKAQQLIEIGFFQQRGSRDQPECFGFHFSIVMD